MRALAATLWLTLPAHLALAAEASPVAVEAFASDVQPVNVGVDLGWGHAHLHVGLGAGRGSQYAGRLTLGWRLDGDHALELGGGVWLVQALTQGARGQGPTSLLAFETDLLSQLHADWTLAHLGGLALFGGVTANYQVSFGPNPVLPGSFIPPVVRLAPEQGGGGHQLWPGVRLGVRL